MTTISFNQVVRARMRVLLGRQDRSLNDISESCGRASNWLSRKMTGRHAFTVPEIDEILSELGQPSDIILYPVLSEGDGEVLAALDVEEPSPIDDEERFERLAEQGLITGTAEAPALTEHGRTELRRRRAS